MRIVVNHLTRMQRGFMCVAGVDPQTLLHVRPVLAGMMKTDMLAMHGGPFELRRVVDLGETQFVGRTPEIEDRRFEAEAARPVDELPPFEFRRLLESVAFDRLHSIFGSDLRPMGRNTRGVLETRGLRSLGCYWAREPRLFMQQSENRPRIRFSFCEDERQFNVPVTDVRLYGADHVTPDGAVVEQFNAALDPRSPALVSIGLSRAYQTHDRAPAVHWLQINNIHLP